MGDQFGLHENVRLLHEQIEKLSSQCKIFVGVVRLELPELPELPDYSATLTISHRKRKKERTVDALALGGDEGRGKLR